MAITVPAPQRLMSARAGHRGAVVYYEAVCVRRAIPEGKLAAVKAVLTTNADSVWGIDYGGSTAPNRDGRGFKVKFKAGKDEAGVNTFLAAVETAVTT